MPVGIADDDWRIAVVRSVLRARWQSSERSLVSTRSGFNLGSDAYAAAWASAACDASSGSSMCSAKWRTTGTATPSPVRW